LQTKSENMLNTKVLVVLFSSLKTVNTFSTTTGGPSLLEQLTADAALMANGSAKQGLAEMGLLFTLLRAYNVLDRVRSSNLFIYFDLTYH